MLGAACVVLAEAQAPVAGAQQVMLTNAEREWLRQHPVIRVRISPRYPPFEFFDQNKFQGIEVDYLTVMEQRLGVKFRPVQADLTWAEVIDRFRSRDGVDLILGITRTEEREQFAAFTDDYISYPQVIISRKNAPFLAGLKDLSNMHIAVERGYVMRTWLGRDVPGGLFVEVGTTEEALNAVATGRADAYVGNLAVASYFIEKRGLVNLKVAAPTPYGDDAMAMGVRRDWPELAGLINKVLRSMSEDEHHAIRNRWLSLRYEHGITVTHVIVGAGAVAGIAMLWIVPLRLLVKRRTAELQREVQLRRESEQKTRAVLDQTFEFIGMLTPDGVLLDVNRTALDFAGIERTEVLGKPFWETPWWIHDRELQGKVLQAVRSAAHGRPVRFDATHRDRTGSIRHIDFSVKPVYDEQGKLIFLVPEGRDVTEAHQADVSLRMSESKYHALFESAGDAIFLMQDDRLIDCNSRTLRMFGCSREQIVGASLARLSPAVQPDGRESSEAALGRIRAALNGTLQRFEWKHIRYDGSPFDAEVILNKVELASGPHLQAIVRDVSERKRMEEERERLEAQLRQAQKMEAIGALAGGVAHDFNNILFAVTGYASLLDMKLRSDDPLRGHVEQILAASERAAGLTKSLLAFSRKQVVELNPVDVNDIVRGFQKILARLIGEDIEFNVRTAPQELIIEADKGQIEQVLMNLTTNARDAMPHGGRLDITIDREQVNEESGAIRSGSYAVVSVSDTGSGMDANTREHIFEPFYTTKEIGKGTGLGLAIVYGIVRKHGGVISVHSEPGRGTTFTIHLPLLPAARRTEAPKEKPVLPSGTETILLVEDDADVRHATKEILTAFGYTVLEAANGEDAERVFAQESDRIGLVLCDLIMPLLNGKETAEALKKRKPGIKVIFMSGYTDDIIGQKGMLHLGAKFIAKPLHPSELLGKVRSVLDG